MMYQQLGRVGCDYQATTQVGTYKHPKVLYCITIHYRCRQTDIRIADFGQRLGREPQSHRSETLSPDNRFEYFLLTERFLFILIFLSGVQSLQLRFPLVFSSPSSHQRSWLDITPKSPTYFFGFSVKKLTETAA